MTDHTIQFTTVTVPVGLGGKSNPYIPDPSPTLLVELASVDRAKEEAKFTALLREAEATAASIRADAETAAASLIADAEESIASLTQEAQASARSITEAAEDEAKSLRAEAEESVSSVIAALATREAELEERSAALDAMCADLEQREHALGERIVAVDAEAAEAAELLSSAQRDADAVLAEARTEAEEILESARVEAEKGARAMIAEARAAVENDPGVAERIAEIESVHRIEVQVLHDREVELLERIAELEARNAVPAPAAETDEDSSAPGEGPAADDDADDAVAIELEGGYADVTVRSDARHNGRHFSESRPTDLSSGPSPITTHAPLTEQLSTSAFRAVPEDRRGRRRR